MKIDVTKIIGYILLSPALISLIMFLGPIISGDEIYKNIMCTLWTGY